MVYQGWRIVGVAALAQAVSVGSTFYAYGVFVKPLSAEFGASRLAVTLGLTLTMVVQGLIAPFLGRALDRFPPRRVMIAGVLLQSAGLLLLSRADAFWQVGALFVGTIAVGSYLFSPLATMALVGRWFVRRRGFALGIAALGSSAGGIAFPPLATAAIEALGWRGAAAAMGIGILALIPPFAFFLIRQPEDVGATPDGDPAPAGGAAPAAAASEPSATVTTGSLVGDRNLWSITLAIGFAYCPVSVLLAHLYPYAIERGIPPARAAIVMSGFAMGSMLGRPFFGWLADRIDKRAVVGIMHAGLALAWSGLLSEPSFEALLVSACAAGFATGGTLVIWGALAGSAFGRASFGSAMGLMNMLMLPFSIAGAPIVARVFDRTGRYDAAFASFLVCFALGALAIAFLRLPAVEPRTRPAAEPEPA